MDLWNRVDELIDRSPSSDDLAAHGLQLLAAKRWRDLGREVPASIVFEEFVAHQRTHDTFEILEHARAAFDGRLVVLKGPEIAARYPERFMRAAADVDLLADDPHAAQRALVAAGFEPLGVHGDEYYEGLHHLRPLGLPGKTVIVEMHSRPNWVDFAEPPRADELFGSAVSGSTGVDGVLALPGPEHAVAVAAHSWGARPLRRLQDLLDIALLTAGHTPRECRQVAGRWGLARLWDTTFSAMEAALFGATTPWALRLWARDLQQARSRTVFEDHLRRWMGPFWALPPHRALVGSSLAVFNELRPAPDETWQNKAIRSREALLHPGRPVGEHTAIIGPEGMRPRHKRRPGA